MASPPHTLQGKLRTILRQHRWLWLAACCGLIGIGLSPGPLLTRSLLGWNIGAWLYLALEWHTMLGASVERIRQVAHEQDESAGTVLAVVTLGCLACLLAICFELAGNKGHALTAGSLALTGATLLSTWLLLPTVFAVHYAHLFYQHNAQARPLQFPDTGCEPVYWDFLYVSFTIALAAQTADVAITSTRARRLVLAQSMLAFVFNMSILGLSINVGASLLA
ncbi:Uncharacterized membrane protein [Andreprevotia lacus DSM 23236]|jgi:uncharacterized membrane protein|uniref:Uncharacterized membrane protein n=1 Tax=Andreprevotia lacus DSM 23236 TaxID=1121001 RepID=A0A1W1XWJ3_9NEIS|nr:DUF1345 domain-containing protein [Andreprevotia lacus]SMC28247.1 Uncharacterized membrane protein [Andreprevotia lacus DSM 23236]